MADLRWDCDMKVCRVKKHPKTSDFDGSFGTNPPRNIQVTDIDCMYEVDGYFLFVELKEYDNLMIDPEYPSTRPKFNGQRHAYEQLSKLQGVGEVDTVTVFYFVGDAVNRGDGEFRVCKQGKWTDPEKITWLELVKRVQSFKAEAGAAHRNRVIARNEVKAQERDAA